MAQDDPIGEFIALPRDQQMSTLQSLSPEKQDRLLTEVKRRRSQPAPWKKITDDDVPQGPLSSGQDPQQIIQEMTKIHPFKNPAAQAVSGVARPLGEVFTGLWNTGKAAFSPPTTLGEKATIAAGPLQPLTLAAMRIAPNIWSGMKAGHEQAAGIRQEGNVLANLRDEINNAADLADMTSDPGKLAFLQRRYPQYDLSTPEKARQVANGLRSDQVYTQGVVAELGALPVVGQMGTGVGERWAAGDKWGAITQAATNAALLADPHIPGTKVRVNEALVSKPLEFTLQQARKLPEAGRRVAQSAMGIGPDATRRAVRDEIRRYNKEVVDVAEENRKALEKHTDEANLAREKHDKEIKAYNEKLDTIQRENQEKIDNRKQEVKRTVQEHRDLQQTHTDWQGVEGERTVLESQILHDVKETEARIRKQAGDKFQAVRDKMGDASVPRERLVGAVDKAQALLRGSKEAIKQFREIANVSAEESPALADLNSAAQNLGHADFKEMWQGLGEDARQNWRNSFGEEMVNEALSPQTGAVDWNQLQGFKEELADKISPGKAYLLGDTYQAVKSLHDSIETAMDDLAKERGVKSQWDEAKSYYRKFKMTFDKDWGKSGSASPVAESSNAVDPVNAGKPFLSPGADMHPAMRDLRNFDPALADRIQRYQQNAKIKAPSKAAAEAGARSYQELAANPELAGGGKFAQQAPKPVDLKDPKSVKSPEPLKIDPFKPKTVEPPEVEVQERKGRSMENIAKGSERVGPGSLYFYASATSTAMGSLLAHVAGVPGGAGWVAIFGPLSIEGIRRFAQTKLDLPGVIKVLSKPSLADVKYLRELETVSPEAAAKVAAQIERIRGQAAGPIKIDPQIARFLTRAGIAGRKAPVGDEEQRARDLVRRMGSTSSPQAQP